MKFLSFVVGLLAISYVFAQDNQCKNDFRTYTSCLKSSMSDGEVQGKTSTYQAKANQCFQQAKCPAPNWNADPANGQKGPYADMPDSVKECVQQKMSVKVASKVNDCLSRHGVSNIDWDELTNSKGSSFDVSHQGAKGAMTSAINAMQAADNCCQQQYRGDTNAMKPLEQCLQTVKKSSQTEVCAKLKPCEAKVQQQCKKRADQIRQALCLCAKEKQLQVAPKLRQLGNQKKVPIEVLNSIVTGENGDKSTLNIVDQCYKENNMPEPFALQAALRISNSNAPQQSGWQGLLQTAAKVGAAAGTRAESPSVSGTTCVLLADMITMDANDQSECNACSN